MSLKYPGYKKRELPEAPKSKSRKFDTISNAIHRNDIKLLTSLLKYKKLELYDFQNFTVLHVAARWGNAETLRVLLEDKRMIRFLESLMYNGDTPLLAAVRHGNVTATQILIEYGADIQTQKKESGNTVLHFAVHDNDCDLINLLLSKNLPLKFINTPNNSGETALEVALKGHSPTAHVLLQAGADYTITNVFLGRNMLHICVAYNHCTILQELLTLGNLDKCLGELDKRGDTPLMLAIRLQCFNCVKLLLNFMKPGQEINNNTQESILHMAVETNDDEILKYILMFSRENIINHRNYEGLTPLLYAIEYTKNRCLERLVKTQNIYVKNKRTGETALHTAIRVDNCFALTILLSPNHHATSWILSQKNNKGKTPFWAAVESGHSAFVIESRKGGWVDIDEPNEYGDSPVFVAASCGHLQVLKALLLSERYYEFCRQHDKEKNTIEKKLVTNAVICCDIYNSDIFILTNKIKRRKFQTWVPKSFINYNKKNGRNIFHACAVGGNVNCLKFVHILYKSFHYDLTLFDCPDKFGNTPLLLATRNDYGGPECVYFFLSNGANISKTNEVGESALKSLLVNTENSVDLLMSVLNDSITYDVTAKGLQEENECLQVNYGLFSFPDEPAIKIIKLFYESIQGFDKTKILQHTLCKTYVHIILLSVNYFFVLRFIMSCFSTLLLTIYVIFYSHETKENADKSMTILGFRFSLGILSILGVLCSAPILFYEDRFLIRAFTYTLGLSPGFLVIYFLLLPYGSNRAFEIVSLAVLASWLSLLMYSTVIFKELSHQIAMLSHVINGMLAYFRIVFLILFPFSLGFYCLFNDNDYFFNPIKSFIYTSFILLQGDTIVSFEYLEKKHFLYYEKSNISGESRENLRGYGISQLDLVLETMLLLVFVITCVLGLMNMLVGLAVRDGRTLAADGEIFRRRLQIHWLNSLEQFLNSFMYKAIRRTPLIYLFGIIPSKTIINLKMNYSPLSERHGSIFPAISVIEMKKSVKVPANIGTVPEDFRPEKIEEPAKNKQNFHTRIGKFKYQSSDDDWSG